MRPVMILFTIIVLSLVGAAVYQQTTPAAAPEASNERTWLSQKLGAITEPSAGTPETALASPPLAAIGPRTTTALGTVLGGLIGYVIRRGPAGIALGALVGYLAASGAFNALLAPPSPAPEPSLWQKLTQ